MPTLFAMVAISVFNLNDGSVTMMLFVITVIPAIVSVMKHITAMKGVGRMMLAVSSIPVMIMTFVTVMLAPAEDVLKKIHCRLPLQ